MQHRFSPIALTALLAAVSVITVVATAVDTGSTADRPALYTTVEAIIGVLALLAAFLAALRVHATRRLDDLVLATAVGALALSHAFYATVPSALDAQDVTWRWAAAQGRLAGAALLVAAAFVPAWPLARARTLAFAIPILAFALVVGAGAWFAGSDEAPTAALGPQGELAGVDVLHAATFAVFAAAAVAFARRFRGERMPLAGWVTLSASLAAVNRLDYLLDPASGLSAVRAGDALRALVYLLLVFGFVKDAADRAAEAAAHRERRRIARDLHDGLAQELAFIARRARGTDGDGELAAAAERALFHSREAIAALRRPEAQSLEVAFAAALDGVATRAGARLELDLAPVGSLTAEERDALVAIAREAVTNAARHAGADVVRVELAEAEGVRLRIVDDGSGFDPEVRRGRRFGLDGMRERADAIGADLRISSRPGGGTEVEVVIP